ncbi:hypothetical protein AB0I06_26185 [Streptomyces sp. NPDC050674]|uniref:hypothetical protein n=1 Tax=Streptomyces sp. NPDC050674 TaxID=3157216 RepID=UPI00344A62B9
MIPAPQPVPRRPRRNTWLRVLVLLLVLLVPGTRAEAQAGPPALLSGESTTVECDVPDTAPRPPARSSRRIRVPLSPAPLREPGPAYTAQHAAPVPQNPPHHPHPPRSEVLRC